jgi:hypothetical protein
VLRETWSNQKPVSACIDDPAHRTPKVAGGWGL